MKTLLVGGGVTSSLIGFFLHSGQSTSATELWERDNDIGGRMRTVHSKYSTIPVDIGAQYLTTNERNLTRFKLVYQSLQNHNVITELRSTIRNMKAHDDDFNYIAPNGMSSVVQHFLNISGCTVRLSHSLKSLNINDGLVEAETTAGQRDHYDTVVLTMPTPEILNITGNFLNKVDQETYDNLKNVQFSSRYVLVLTYDKQIQEDWAACYMPNDNMIRYLGIQEKKTGVASPQSSVVIHSSIDFDQQFPSDNSKHVQSLLIDRISHLFPMWGTPVNIYCRKWQYSQVIKPLRTSSKTLILNAKPLIVLAGDSFNHSNFDNCIESALEASELLMKANSIC